MSDASRGSADSYIGSLISLTSKSEIRYEGVLYTVDTANSNIALQDVRSFGTEGRKKDGPQIPPSDKVYDYIIFRATDIKDLQVKRSPPVQTSVNDPAIVSIQTQYSGPALASSFPSPLRGSIDGNFHGSYPNIPPGAFQSNTHSLYPPPGLGSWPAGSENVALPMGWPQYYRPPTGLSNLQQHQPSPLQSQAMLPGLQTSITQQQQQQEPSFQLSQQKLFPTLGSMPTPTAQQTFPIMSSAESLVKVSNSIDRALSGLSSSLNTNASTSSILTGLLPEISLPSPRGLGPVRTNSGRLSGDVGPIMSAMQSSQVFGSFQGTSSLSTAAVSLIGHRGMGTSTSPALLAPAQLLQSDVFSPSSGQVSSAMVAPSTAEDRLHDSTKAPSPLISISSAASSQQVTTEPLLPLPTAPLGQRRQPNETNGFYANNYQIRRGRGRGRGSGGLQPAPGRGRYNEDRIKFAWVPYANKQFTEDFDFTAMNEKFNKDEVWDELGKGENKNKDVSREELVDNALAELEMGFEQLDDSRKPVYVKDDFFDTLSCDALDREQRNERFDFSERRKLDTETFGSSISRPRNGRGGRIGSYRGGYRGTFQGNQGYRGGNAYRGRFRGVSRTRTDPHQ